MKQLSTATSLQRTYRFRGTVSLMMQQRKYSLQEKAPLMSGCSFFSSPLRYLLRLRLSNSTVFVSKYIFFSIVSLLISFFPFPFSSKEATLLVSSLSVKEPVASAQPAPPCSKETIVTVNVHAAKDLIASGHRFLDVRTKEEFSNGHLENSINVPFLFFTPQGREKNPKFLEEVSSICCKDDHIVVSCQTGNRGSMACTALLSADFKNVKNMGGGFEAWESNGFELKKPEDGSRM